MSENNTLGLGGFPPPDPQPRKTHRFRNWVVIPVAGLIGLILVIGIIAGIAGGSGNKAAKAPVVAPTTFSASPQSADVNGVTCDPSTMTDGYCPGDEPVTESPTPSGPAMLTMGETEIIGSNDTGATEGIIVVGSRVVSTQPADSYGSAPKHGYFVIVTVRATADQGYTDGFDVSSSDFYALSGGSHYDEGDGNSYSALSDSGDELGYTTLAASESVSGKLVFDVPSRHGHIVYAPNYDGQPLAEWSY